MTQESNYVFTQTLATQLKNARQNIQQLENRRKLLEQQIEILEEQGRLKDESIKEEIWKKLLKVKLGWIQVIIFGERV